MFRRTGLAGFGTEEAAPPAHVEAGERRGRRHGHGLGLRPSRYVGRHRLVEETNGHRPERAERRKVKKARDYGFGS
jgi:hypothetical protein